MVRASTGEFLYILLCGRGGNTQAYFLSYDVVCYDDQTMLLNFMKTLDDGNKTKILYTEQIHNHTHKYWLVLWSHWCFDDIYYYNKKKIINKAILQFQKYGCNYELWISLKPRNIMVNLSRECIRFSFKLKAARSAPDFFYLFKLYRNKLYTQLRTLRACATYSHED